MSDLIKTIKFALVSYVEIDADEVTYEYVGDDVYHVEECTGTEYLTFDDDKKECFEPIIQTVFDALGVKCVDDLFLPKIKEIDV